MFFLVYVEKKHKNSKFLNFKLKNISLLVFFFVSHFNSCMDGLEVLY